MISKGAAGRGVRIALRGCGAKLLLPLIVTHASLRLRLNLLPSPVKFLLAIAKMKKPTLYEGRPFSFLVAGA
jgi:hypothetical protein